MIRAGLEERHPKAEQPCWCPGFGLETHPGPLHQERNRWLSDNLSDFAHGLSLKINQFEKKIRTFPMSKVGKLIAEPNRTPSSSYIKVLTF